MLLYDWILLFLGFVIHICIYYLLYMWLDKNCECMNTYHKIFLQFYMLFYIIFYSVMISYFIIFGRVMKIYDIGLIFLNSLMIYIGIDYMRTLERCYCSDSIEKQILLIFIILYCIWYVSLIISFSFRYMK